jgi:hypothetical protein
MVEFATREGYDSYGELAEFRVIDGGIGTEGTAKFGIEVVLFEPRS